MPVRLSAQLLAGLAAAAAAGAPALRGAEQHAWHHVDVPNPQEAPGLCHLNASEALCDADEILSPDGRARALAILRRVREETSAPCSPGARGYQIGVALVRRMHADDWASGGAQETAKQFATEIGNRWGVGEKGCDNGIMVFLSIGDRAAYIKTAPGSRGALSDSRALLVLESMTPLLRKGMYDDALAQGLSDIKAALQGKQGRDVAGGSTSASSSIFLNEYFWICLFVVVGLASEAVTCGNGLIVWLCLSDRRSDTARSSSSFSFGGGGGFELGGGAGITW